MENKYSKTITENYAVLLRAIDTCGGLLDLLWPSDILKSCMQSIQNLKVVEEQNARLLQFLLEASASTVETFIKALRDSSQHHIADMLESKTGNFNLLAKYSKRQSVDQELN